MADDLKCRDGGRHVWVVGSCWKCNVAKHKYLTAKRAADNEKKNQQRKAGRTLTADKTG